MRDKAALITGGATGIGKRTAIALAENGVHLVINYRSSQKEAVSLCKELTEKYGTKNIAIQGDITISSDCEKMAEAALSEFPAIDILIHNAGPYVHERKEMADYTFEQWNYLINGNLNAVFYLSKLLLPKMRENKWGRIVTIGFDRVEAASGWIYRSAFAAAKTGAASLTKSIALEEAGNGITANMVCPGDIIGEWKEKNIEDITTVEDSASPVGRPGTGEDIARVISFLADEKSGFITGSIIPVTGGKDVLGKIYQE
ncbi:3-oxoacyl-[acyl-carrier protein] reductase [Cytobacillus oceanisediminis]|uniref:3-oxoacyl-[acyl-carrier protein] reductase n=1 Tax=Cytobacillus oceanisediminis TaxID=665099 RepID=A0A2V3A0D8_9BACI|nr:SDR family oxidoreductase [Cytobacillus oceanisediminis]PWW30171.1 3-oxoacyl-[acyl-carrier protein] reductase [Cytobacillus oceanisediminis]